MVRYGVWLETGSAKHFTPSSHRDWRSCTAGQAFCISHDPSSLQPFPRIQPQRDCKIPRLPKTICASVSLSGQGEDMAQQPCIDLLYGYHEEWHWDARVSPCIIAAHSKASLCCHSSPILCLLNPSAAVMFPVIVLLVD
jgi:hypothetical protein